MPACERDNSKSFFFEPTKENGCSKKKNKKVKVKKNEFKKKEIKKIKEEMLKRMKEKKTVMFFFFRKRFSFEKYGRGKERSEKGRQDYLQNI